MKNFKQKSFVLSILRRRLSTGVRMIRQTFAQNVLSLTIKVIVFVTRMKVNKSKCSRGEHRF